MIGKAAGGVAMVMGRMATATGDRDNGTGNNEKDSAGRLDGHDDGGGNDGGDDWQ